MTEDVRELVRMAFRAARERGKPDWHRMSAAVLKNRLLQLSNGHFREADHGSPAFVPFLRTLTDIVRVDGSTTPPTVELLDRASVPTVESAASSQPRTRIRSDLWRAIMDYRSRIEYVWDPEQALAREAKPGESLVRMPTVSKEEFADWRREFAGRHNATLDASAQARLGQWESQGLPTYNLPRELQGLWNQEVKTRVEERLRGFFAKNGLEAPRHLVTEAAYTRTRGGKDDEALRTLIIECIRAMTREELEELRLPPSAILRAQRRDGVD